MNRIISTSNAPEPASHYAQGVESPKGARLVHVAGQIGALPGEDLPQDLEAQHRNTWRNVLAILEAAGMGRTDIVDIFGIVTDPAGVPLFRRVREEVLGTHRAASTLIVAGLANPDWKVEISVRAAHVD